MAMIASSAPIAIDVMKPSWKEVTEYLWAVIKFISHQVICIKGYKITKFEIMYLDRDHAKIMKCMQIASEFKMKYLKFKF